MHRLNSGRVIDMSHSRNIGTWYVQQINAPQLARGFRHRNSTRLYNWRNEQHIGAVHIHLEVVGNSFAQDRRSKGPKRLAEFDFQVHHRLHLGTSSVTNDATSTE